MTFQLKPKSHSKAALSEPHQWLESAMEENHIKYFDYSYFRDFNFVAAGAFGKVEKAVYDFAGSEVVYALKSIFHLQDENIEKKPLAEFIKEVSTCLYVPLSVYDLACSRTIFKVDLVSNG